MDDRSAERLMEAILLLTRALECKNDSDWRKSLSELATKQDLEKVKEQIMSAISDFATKQNVFNDRQDAAITDLQGDVQFLNNTIAKLQSSPGTITPEDQALLDALEARASATADKLDALDALTPPAPPATPAAS